MDKTPTADGLEPKPKVRMGYGIRLGRLVATKASGLELQPDVGSNYWRRTIIGRDGSIMWGATNAMEGYHHSISGDLLLPVCPGFMTGDISVGTWEWYQSTAK